MAQNARGVIGAGYGDEGKGLLTDALAAALGPGTLVVRSNGGAQAGHTVVTPDGRRHVFHHVGSGALAGAATHLSRFFVHHPMLLGAEVRVLARLGACCAISADPRGYVTTPWDMLVNQAVERARRDRRHGSCGYGFGETVGRCEETEYGLNVSDLARPKLRERLLAIRHDWLPARLQALGVEALSEEFQDLLGSDRILDRFLDDARTFGAVVRTMPDVEIATAKAVIFEGAQGLLLDQHYGPFPHVTRSNTGIRNMLALAEETGISELSAVYATRCYLTRHGRGPMPNETDIGETFAVDDPTNRPNDWQESLRFGLLDLDQLAKAIAADSASAAASPVKLTKHVAVTCLDQVRDQVTFRQAGRDCRATPDAFSDIVAVALDVLAPITSTGPTRSTMQGLARLTATQTGAACRPLPLTKSSNGSSAQPVTG